MIRQLLPGSASPLGATVTGGGVNFAVYSSHAEQIDLCLFDDSDQEVERLPLPVRQDYVFHGFLPDAGPGLRYGYRAHGSWEPVKGLRFNAAKLLIDPYAYGLDGATDATGPLLDYHIADTGEWSMDETDSAVAIARSVVIERAFDWEGVAKPHTPLHRTVVYEAHAKGLSRLMDGVPEPLRGTYAGIANQTAIDYLVHLGVTALELDHYPGMTEASIETLARETGSRFGISSLLAVHRAGHIPAGETVVFVAAAAAHRRAAFQAADCLMDRLKTDAVFWKREITAGGGARRIEPHDKDHEDQRRWMEDDGGHR